MAQLQGKTALVTGGAAGIGREIVYRFAEEGARVISVDWNAAENEKTASNASYQAVTADVSSPADVARAFEIAGPVDILVNNAAFSQGDGFLLDISEEVWDKTLAVCLKSVFLCSKTALKGMVERRAGVIINISSVNALTGIHLAAYTAAKGGIISLTRVLAAQYGGLGLRINTICPGTILSESSRAYYEAHPEIASGLASLYPARKFGTTTDIASAALFLASDEATFINGTVLTVDGGLSAVHQIVITS
ncbi:MAG TPA: SDR family oxidoreductase [Bryobacteraceae bacterium]|jgi:NAD(P)-dependent dehydrogenase (short-subunit alcohol dehydrogenase family)|nr:SDR family oxidoreductase [Bryobacteraceae bacterium]